MKKFLVIQTAFLGDAILATALLEKLHVFFPDSAIDMVVRKGNEGLLDGHPFLNRLFVWDKRSNKARNLFKLVGEIRKQRYDHVINCQRFFSTGLMTLLARGDEKIGYDKNPLSFQFTRKVNHIIGDGRHEVLERHIDILKKHFVHFMAFIQQDQGAHRDARRFHINQQEANAFLANLGA